MIVPATIVPANIFIFIQNRLFILFLLVIVSLYVFDDDRVYHLHGQSSFSYIKIARKFTVLFKYSVMSS